MEMMDEMSLFVCRLTVEDSVPASFVGKLLSRASIQRLGGAEMYACRAVVYAQQAE